MSTDFGSVKCHAHCDMTNRENDAEINVTRFGMQNGKLGIQLSFPRSFTLLDEKNAKQLAKKILKAFG